MADKELLAVVRAHHARRKFNSTLEQLCVETIARNDEFFATHAGQSARLFNDLVPSLKTQILAELSEQIFGHPRYPATKHRVKLVQLLIHPRLEEFDFAACGDKFGKVANQQVWKCLAETAGQRLRCVRDLRIKNNAVKTRTLAWCLPYLALMPHLEKLLLTTLSCCNGELVHLAKAAPKLAVLQLFLNNSLNEELEIKSVFNMKSLGELIIYGNNEKVQGLMPILLKEMPQLKINCMRTDEHYMHNVFNGRHQMQPGMRGPFYLEHICLVMNAPEEYRFNYSEIPNVKHLMLACFLGPCYYPTAPVEDYSQHFPNLETIHFKGCIFSFMIAPVLQVNGKFITCLILDSHNALKSGWEYNPYWIFENCPNLTDLKMKKLEAAHAYPFAERIDELENLPLRNLTVVDCILGEELLGWLLQRAPMLEVLVLDTVHAYDGYMFMEPARLLADKDICLAHLRSFKLTLNTQESHIFDLDELYNNSYEFVKNLFTACTNLRQVAVDLQEYIAQNVETKSLDIVQDIIND